MKRISLLVVLIALLSGFDLSFAAGESSSVPEVPVKGMVTLVDIGADKCIPCRMMAPVLRELEEGYRGRVAIVFIDVWKNPGQEKKFGIRSIPTQVFYDKDGKEIQRHEGFLDKTRIIEVFRGLGIQD